MVKKIALFVFLLVSILDIIGIIFKIDSLTFIFKPFILLALLFLYSQSVEFRNKWYAMALIFSFFGCENSKNEKPNIIYILADDLGYGEVGVFGQKLIETPKNKRPLRTVVDAMTGKFIENANEKTKIEYDNFITAFGMKDLLN